MKAIILLAFCFVCISNISCNKKLADPANAAVSSNEQDDALTAKKAKTYIIYKGDNYCTPNPLVFTSKSAINFTAVFDSSCIYTTADSHNQDDVNKLYGFSDCNSQHLINSARVGWRWSKDSLRLFAFVHNDGAMLIQEITTAEIGSTINCSITCNNDTYTFIVNGKTATMPRHCSGKYSRYKLFPYFGGNETAPHDIKIVIQEL